MKRTCEGCKALEKSRGMGYCDLGFSHTNTLIKILGSIFYETKPLEDCPKPKTNKEYVNLKIIKGK